MTDLPENGTPPPGEPVLLTGAPSPAPTVRRGIRRRAVALVGLAVIGIAAGAVSLDRTVTPKTVGVAAASDPSAGFDPLIRYARFGWLPDGLVHRTTMVQTGRDGAYTMEAGLPDKYLGAAASVTLFPRGVAPHLRCLAVDTSRRSETYVDGEKVPYTDTPGEDLRPAPPVNGQAAQWVVRTYDRAEARLRWEYQPGAWAEIGGKDLDPMASPEGGPPRDIPAMLHRIASTIQYGGGTERLRFPLAVASVPRELRLASVLVTERSMHGWRATLLFTSGTYCATEDDPSGLLAVAASAIVPGLGWGGGRHNTTVDGRLAYRDSDGGREGLDVFDVPGPQVGVATGDAATRALLGADGLTALYRRVTVLGTVPKHDAAEPTDLATWTDNPVR